MDCWLHENKLTLSTSTANSMLSANSQKLKGVSLFSSLPYLTESTFKHLGFLTTENLCWAHMLILRVRRLSSVLRRINHLLPINTPWLYVWITVILFGGDTINEMLSVIKIGLDCLVNSLLTDVLRKG